MDKRKLNFAVVAELINLAKHHAAAPAGSQRWEFLAGRKLVWFDSASHICTTPPERFTNSFRLQTVCGVEVTTPELRVVDDAEGFEPSCPDCCRTALAPQTIAAHREIRPTVIGCALAAAIVGLHMGLFDDDFADPPAPTTTTHQLTYAPDDFREPLTFDDL